MMSLFLLNSFMSFVRDYFPYIIVGLMILVFVIIVSIAASKKRKPLKYVSDDIDRSVDAVAQEKASQKKTLEAETKSETNVEAVATKQPTFEQESQAKDDQEQEDFIYEPDQGVHNADEEDQEEITLESQNEEPNLAESKPTKYRNISYRILYDKETKMWEVRKDNAKRVIRRVKTKKEALEIAHELSERQDLNLVVHKKDGKFQKKR